MNNENNSVATWVCDATEADFQIKVIEQSNRVPVLLDLWAPWCSPCRELLVTLEKLTAEYQGAFHLVKVNIDENQQLALGLQVQSIPAVKLLSKGQLVGEFLGALSEEDVREFLQKYLSIAATKEHLQAEDLALSRWHLGERAEAEAVFREVLQQNPANSAARIGMGLQAIYQGQLAKAKEESLAASKGDLTEIKDTERRRWLSGQLGVLTAMVLLFDGEKNPPAAKETEASAASDYQAACQQALKGEIEPALARLLALVKSQPNYGEQAPKQALLAVLRMLPQESELVKSYQRKLSSLMFS